MIGTITLTTLFLQKEPVKSRGSDGFETTSISTTVTEQLGSGFLRKCFFFIRVGLFLLPFAFVLKDGMNSM